MTSPVRSSLSPKVLLAGLALTALVFLLAGPPARAGHDDFEFGRKLAAARKFEYARMVFDGLLANREASEEQKDEARYGLALLMKEKAITTADRQGQTLETVEGLFSQAANDIETFVKKNPKSPHATQARLDVGTIRLAFVQWARELLDDPAEVDDRGFDILKLREAAADNVRKAMEYFGQLRPKESELKPKDYQQLAEYYYVISQYYAALVEEPCSTSAVQALGKASLLLDDYIMLHEGQLLSIYAMDIYGLVWWERAKCETNEELKKEYYDKAFEWFEACVYTTDEGPDHLRVITNGYFHMAQVGLDADQLGGRNFARDALTHLAEMLANHPTAWRTDSGLRAMIEWSKIECRRGNATRAVEIAQEAGERAKRDGKGYLERIANRQLNEYVSGSCGGSISGLKPEVLLRVAQDLYAQARYPEAIRAFRGVIDAASTPAPTSEGFVTYAWGAWQRISSSYRKMDDLLGAALALQPIHDAWMNGLIPKQGGEGEDDYQQRASKDRFRSMTYLKSFLEKVDLAPVEAMRKQMQKTFTKDYPDTVEGSRQDWVNAMDEFRAAHEGKKVNSAKWRAQLEEAKALLRKITTNPKDSHQEKAWVNLVRAEVVGGKNAEAVKVADEALATWEKPEYQEQEKKFETVRGRRNAARAEIMYWKADAYVRMDQPAKVVETLGDFLERYPRSTKPFPRSFALAHLISALLDEGDLERGDALYRRLLRDDPGFQHLSTVTFKFADHYNAQRKELEKVLIATKTAMNEVRPKLRQAEKDFHRLSAGIGDTRNQLDKLRQALILFRKNQELKAQGKRPSQKVSMDVIKAAREEEDTGRLAKRKEEWERLLKKATSDRVQFSKTYEDLLQKRRDIELAIFEPLTKAASYYKEWDATLVALQKSGQDVKRDPSNLLAFGTMYWTAAGFHPEDEKLWLDAEYFLDSYLGHPEIKRLPADDRSKRQAIARLGNVYVNLAERQEAPAERRRLVTKAVDLLQSSIALDPRDNDLVVSLLSNKVLVLQWRDRTAQKTWRFPIAVPATAKELRDNARDLASESNPFRPVFQSDQEASAWKRALDKFLRQLQMMDDKALVKFLPKEGATSFDARLFKQLADSGREFRMALAWAYTHTERDEDFPKALNLLLTFLRRGPLQAVEDSEQFWKANQILMDLYMGAATRWIKDGSTSSKGAAALDRAADLVKKLHAYYPRFGEATVPGNDLAWRAKVDHLNKLRGDARMPRVLLQPVAAPAAGSDATKGEK